MRTLLLLAAAAAALAAGAFAQAPEPIYEEWKSSLAPLVPLEQGWEDPPRLAKTRCWWWWLNANVTPESITRELEEMKAKGYGGANIIDAGGFKRGNKLVPHGPDFGTPAWRELFEHAVAEADRLGLELGFNITSGWNLGGPLVTPEYASKKLTWTETTVEGGAVDVTLPQPAALDDYYRDAAVVAFPAGEGELPRIHNFEQKAYHKYPGRFTATKAWHLLETEGDPQERACAPEDVIDITEHVDAQGRLRWQVPEGRWQVIRLGYTYSGAHVAVHSEGWTGRSIDYLSREAFDFYWREVMDPIVAEVEPYLGGSLRFFHTDSWELGPVNWTPKMPAEFKRINGYDITPFVPALVGYVVEDREISTRFLNDFRVVLAQLIAENKYMAFAEHAHEVGVGTHPESGGPHAAPFDALLNLGRNDVPMGEFWARSETHRVTDEERIFVKQTASAAHTYGKRLSLAEAFTTIGPNWERDPQQLKPVFDRVCCEGHNLTMWHTFAASPKEMGIPGQVYHAGTHLNPQVTWWEQAGAFIGYMNRCQFLLQQGLFVADALYFYGENIPAFVRLQVEDPAQVLPGYDYDVINREALLTRARVEQGQIVLPDGMRYRLLALPEHDAISLDTMEHIAQMVDAGATVVGKKPAKRLGLSGGPDADARFAELTARLWDEVGAEGNANGGRVYGDTSAGSVLLSVGMGGAPRDFRCTYLEPRMKAKAPVDYIHRRTDKSDIYFVVNREPEPARFDCTFRVTGKQPELWDPLTGERRDARAFEQVEETTTLPLTLDGEGAMFVVFTRDIAPDTSGTAERNFPRLEEVKQLEGPWRVQFDPEWGPAEPVVFEELTSWHEHEDPAVRYFSGTAVYHNTFTLEPEALQGEALYLELGDVQNVAEVKLNGQDLGVVWARPFRIEIKDAAKAGENTLDVTVVNMWPNRIIGDAHLPPEQRRTRTTVTTFTKESPLLPSGLLGPVRLLKAK